MKMMWMAVLSCGLAACGDRVSAIDALEGDATAGAALYETHCQGCHGDDARSGSAGENLAGQVVDERSEFIQAILRGKENGAMPSFEQTLSDQEIADILAHIADLG
jgi:mono/diheme cytochrome c family protein